MKFATKYSGTNVDKKKEIGCQKWDPKAFFIMKGKKIIIRDYVQENAEGTDFYKNLEKFGNLETTIEFMSKNRAELIGDFNEAISLKDLEERRLKLLEIFERLPVEIRGQFNNSFQEFMNNGAEFFDEQAKILNQEIKNETKPGTTEQAGAVQNSSEVSPKEA